MFNRSPSRALGPLVVPSYSSRLPACLPFRLSLRSVFRIVPFFVSGGGAKSETGVEPVGKSGRGSSVG